jgi:hypothetical protein
MLNNVIPRAYPFQTFLGPKANNPQFQAMRKTIMPKMYTFNHSNENCYYFILK